MWCRVVSLVVLAQLTACSFAVVPSQSPPEAAQISAPADCESKSAAPMIDTILAVGFAAATFAAVSAEEGEDPEVSAVSALGVGTATTAAFIASAAHGHNAIQSCLAQRHKSSQAKVATAAAATTPRPGALASRATYAVSVSATQ